MLDAYWRAANYLSVGQIYLLDNPLLREPLRIEHVKPRLLGHWGTTPGLNFVYAHLNRVIRERDLNAIYVAGPGHGGPGLVANVYLEGTYSEVYPHIGRDEEGLRRLFRQFSFPGGIPSHVAPETPGSIHEGGELGYSLAHAYGAAFDNPDLLVCCVVGDGEAETGPLATSWHSNKFLNPARDGAVLPVLHLNGYKIANPTVLARIPQTELRSLLEGYGYAPRFVEGDDPQVMHQLMAATLDEVTAEIAEIQRRAREDGELGAPALADDRAAHPQGLDRPEGGRRAARGGVVSLPPGAARRPGRQPRAPAPAGGVAALLPARGAVRRARRAARGAGRARARGRAAHGRQPARQRRSAAARAGAARLPRLRRRGARADGEHQRAHARARRVPARGDRAQPDELPHHGSRRDGLQPPGRGVRGHQPRVGRADACDSDDHLAPDGRVMEVLSEHLCQGWLEGYLLTGRHGLFNSYEAFIHIVDSMFNQHAKWLKVTRGIPWRAPIASLNYLLSSHVWRQDHNGFSHQDPGFIDHVVNKKAEIVRVYLPPDANCLLSVADHCLRSRDYVNVIVAGKQPALNYLDDGRGGRALHARDRHVGLGVQRRRAGARRGARLRRRRADARERRGGGDPARALPELKVRVVNVVDLMRLEPDSEHPHGLPDAEFDALFTTERPVIFAYHGYPWLIHRLTYRRTNHDNIHVRGYKEEGTTTTPFDMVMLNDLDRFHLVMDVIDRVPGLAERAAHLRQEMVDERLRHRAYTREHGEDPPDVTDWSWPGSSGAGEARTRGLGAADAGPGRQRRLEQPQADAARRR